MSGALAEALAHALATSTGRAVDGDGAAHDGLALLARARDAATLLTNAGVTANEPVHLAIGNRATDIAALLGIWLAGAVAVPIHLSASTTTRASVGTATGARFHLDGGELTRIAATPPAPRPQLDGAALIVFTSGTTGLPKGVVLGHDAFAGKLRVLDGLLGLRRDDVVLLPLQLTFIFGTWVALLTLIAGGTVMLMPKFTVPAATTSLAAGATVLAAVPTMLRALMSDAPPAPALRMVLTGGEMFGAALSRRVAQDWPEARVFDLYGSTETGSCDFCLGPDAQADGIGSIGVPTTAVQVRLAGADQSGGIGELQIRTPFGMLDYLDDPALTAQSFSDGYFRTGDLGRLRPDSRVELVGRSKEMISRGGNKVAPLEIDTLLCGHPAVAAALCAGVPDERLGEAIHAVVVLQPGASLDGETLRDWARQRIEPYKLPDRITFADALPLGATGKASRAAVKMLAEAAVA
jgi:long-chain acyl-CoA synthetase